MHKKIRVIGNLRGQNEQNWQKIPKLTQCSSTVWRHHCFQDCAQTKVVSIQFIEHIKSIQATLIHSIAKAHPETNLYSPTLLKTVWKSNENYRTRAVTHKLKDTSNQFSSNHHYIPSYWLYVVMLVISQCKPLSETLIRSTYIPVVMQAYPTFALPTTPVTEIVKVSFKPNSKSLKIAKSSKRAGILSTN